MNMGVLIATPYSDLFADYRDKQDILAMSDIVELRKPSQVKLCPCQSVLWHCEYSIVAPWSRNEWGLLEDMARSIELGGQELLAVSFHVLSRFRENDLQNGVYIGRGQPMSKNEMLANAVKNIQSVRRIFPGISLLVENNNHLSSDAYDVITEPLFLTQLIEKSGVGLLLDVAHARITALNTDMAESDYISSLPLSGCIQVHLSRHGINNNIAFDAHESLQEDDWTFWGDHITGIHSLKYVTIEYYKKVDVLVEQLSILRTKLNVGEKG